MTALTGKQGAEKPGKASAASLVQFISLAIAFVMAALDATVVNVAADDIRQRLALTIPTLTWVVDGYILTFAAFLLLSGALSRRFGAKRVYLIGLVVFVVSSLLCALAPAGTVLVLARLVQGTGAALFMPASMVLLMQAYPEPASRARVVGLWSAAGSVASGFGPIVGGVLVGTLGWRSIFLVNVPIGIVGFVLTARGAAAVGADRSARLRPAGHGPGIVVLAGVSFTLIEGNQLGWSSPAVLAAAAVTVLAATVFVLRERRSQDPVFPAALFGDARFSMSNISGFLLNFGLYGALYMIGLFLQKERGASPLLAGAELLPIVVVFMLGNLTYARIVKSCGPVVRLPMVCGLATAAAFTAGMTTISASTPYWLFALLLSAANYGLGLTVPALTSELMSSVGSAHASVGGATFNANRQVGTLVGVAVTGALLSSALSWYSVARISFAIAAAAYLTGLLLVLAFLGKSDRTGRKTAGPHL